MKAAPRGLATAPFSQARLALSTCSGFALKPADAIGVTREFIRQNLDRDFTLQLQIACAIDLAHAPATKQGQYFQSPELGANRDQSTTSPHFAGGFQGRKSVPVMRGWDGFS